MKKPIHYGTNNGPACGARFQHDGLTDVFAWRDVTCKRCKVTDAYERAKEGGDLSGVHILAMNTVRAGGDVFDRTTAVLLREVEKNWPHLITITKAVGRYRGEERLPYFGAIVTDEGAVLLRRAGFLV